MIEFHYRMNAKEVAMALRNEDMAKVLATLNVQNSAYFTITALSPSQVPEAVITRNCRLLLPAWFVKEHQGKLKVQDFVVLWYALSIVPCKVRLRMKTKTIKNSETYFGKGWKAFARINNLMIGDSLIFHLKGMSEFYVHIFRGAGNPTAVSSSHAAPTKCSSGSEFSRKNGQDDSSAECSTYQQLSVEVSDGSLGLPDDQCEAITRKRKLVKEVQGSGAVCTRESASLIKLRHSELGNVQVSSLQMRHDFRNGQEPPVHQRLKVPFTGAQKTGARIVCVKEEFQHSAVSLPSFIQRLVMFNVQDTAGNTSGARFDVPLGFVKKHNILLQPHVKLQGIRESSPFRTVTCSYNMLQDSEERSTRPPLSLEWGDFVRDNAFQAGQQLVFTLASGSFFVIREVCEIVIYTK